MKRTGALLGAVLLMLLTALTGQPAVAGGSDVTAAASVEAQPVEGAPDDTLVPNATAVLGAQKARLSGTDRYASAVAISRHRYADPAGARVVYLSRGDSYTDALTAGTLTDGPVLLTRGGCGAVPASVLAEVRRLNPTTVIALGGTGAVCDAALTEAAQGRATSRLGGATAAETAALIARRAFPDGASRVYLTRGAVTPDAVVGGMLSDGPILLVGRDGTGVPGATATTIAALRPSRVVALGGSGAVSDSALSTAAAGRATGRLAGADRYATAVAIAQHAYPGRTARAYLARGDGQNYVDAVASGMLTDGPVLLTPGSCAPVNSRTASALKTRHPSTVVALGGTGALCKPTLDGAALDARPTVNCATTACVAITFDDGPSALTPQVLDIFASARVPANFFVVGKRVAERSSVARHTWISGHEIGNHTYDHVRLTELTRAQQQDQMTRTDTTLRGLGIPTTTTMRPPFLAFNTDTRNIGKAVVMTDVNPKDWDGPSASQIRTFIRTNVRSGSIVILHDTVPNTVTALPGVLSDLQSAGYTVVTVRELIPNLRAGDLVYNRTTRYSNGVEIDPSGGVTLQDGRVLPTLEDTTGELTPDS